MENNKISYLKDVFICSLSAFGGPASHYGIFTQQLVKNKKYITEEDLIELIALCSFLPGPTSTQTIISIGYKLGGSKLALYTFLIWALPAIIIMGALSLLYQYLSKINSFYYGLRYIGPMAVGFIIIAAININKKVVKDKTTLILLLFSTICVNFVKNPFIFPIVLIIGGITSIITNKEENKWNNIDLKPPWKYFVFFILISLISPLITIIFNNNIVNIFSSFYRYGYLVFGGGQVVIASMQQELVEIKTLMTNLEFLTGYGLVQGIPGPMFSFSSYAASMALRDLGTHMQILGSFLASIGIFLPGILLIFFIYPIWEDLKKVKGIKISLRGINAAAGGLITASALIFLKNNGLFFDNIIISILTALILHTKVLPPPLVVVLTIVTGFII